MSRINLVRLIADMFIWNICYQQDKGISCSSGRVPRWDPLRSSQHPHRAHRPISVCLCNHVSTAALQWERRPVSGLCTHGRASRKSLLSKCSQCIGDTFWEKTLHGMEYPLKSVNMSVYLWSWPEAQNTNSKQVDIKMSWASTSLVHDAHVHLT